ncbi:MAG: type II toxin-antitoxin system PemK/MazF family toxin [Bryobacterales bacterium]|nr:type II toxin-antitoxin system PemK/MazF family toxin [Bryobacterales bacterium]
MTLRTGEVVLIRMQFHQTQGSKVRPALVLLDTGDDDFVAAPVTSQLRSSEFDFTLVDWQAAGLNVPSSARVHKLTVLPKSDVVRRLRLCSASDRGALRVALCKIFCPE